MQPTLAHSASDTTSVLTLNPDQAYTLTNLGIDDEGGATTDYVAIAIGAEPGTTDEGEPEDFPVDLTERANKAILLPGIPYEVGPGVASVWHRSSTDTVLVNVAPYPKAMGQY